MAILRLTLLLLGVIGLVGSVIFARKGADATAARAAMFGGASCLAGLILGAFT